MKEQQPVQDTINQEEELNHGMDVDQGQSHEAEEQMAPEAEAASTNASDNKSYNFV